MDSEAVLKIRIKHDKEHREKYDVPPAYCPLCKEERLEELDAKHGVIHWTNTNAKDLVLRFVNSELASQRKEIREAMPLPKLIIGDEDPGTIAFRQGYNQACAEVFENLKEQTK